MVGSSSRSIAPNERPTMQAPSPPTSPLERKASKAWTSTANEPSGSFSSRGTQHRRKSSSNQEKGKTTSTKSDAKPSRSQGESSAKRKEQNRIAQRAFRKRQKAHLEELEAEVIEKGSRIKEITENNGVLLETMKQLQNQNIEMKSSRVPIGLGYQLPFLTATGTPLTSEPGRDENCLDHANVNVHHQGSGREIRHVRTQSNSENSPSSSSDTHDSITSSPDVLSPVTMQGPSVLRTPHLGALTGLQSNLQPSAESTSYPTPISASTSFQSLQNGSFSHMGYTFTPPSNQSKPPDGQQHWLSFGNVPGVYQPAFGVPDQQQFRPAQQFSLGLQFSPGQQFSPIGHQIRQPPSVPAQSYLPPPPLMRRNSEALTHHHVRSLPDLTALHAPMPAPRPHTTISTSRDPSKMRASSQMSMSVPTNTIRLPNSHTDMLLSQAFPSSPSQPVSPGPVFAKQVVPQHLKYQRPTHGHSVSASNIGLSFSSINPPNPLGSGDLQYDYTKSSATYFSNLSIQPQSTLTMEMDRMPHQGHHHHDFPGTSMDGWADMMPSMGATTPLQELSNGTQHSSLLGRSTGLLTRLLFPFLENPLDTAGSEPLAIDQQNHSLSSNEQPYSPEPSIFSLTGLDHAGGLEFPFAPMQMFSSPPETRES
ncbi:hypothetical protein QFC21_004692 [Naganishia friedmannii]|uniref:Uncharacterized protein n=1 Tax=Naganishia friedmannii TaxID=89922 RepID=A0ACC2VF04_9TREE|nr:hypothetical protein QFC21_004692 [Naganishia friedmannii]